MIGISLDTTEDNARFAAKFRFPFSLAGSREVCLSYGACDSDRDEYARRIAYVIDEEGRIAKAFSHVDPKTFPAALIGELSG